MCLPQSPPPHLLSGSVKLFGTAALSSSNGTHHPALQARRGVFCLFLVRIPFAQGREASQCRAAKRSVALVSPQPPPALSLPHAPAALRTPLNPRAARVPSFHAARHRLLSPSAATPTPQPPLLGTTSARGRCRKRSRLILGSSAKLRPRPREPKAHPPRRTPPSRRAACHMTQMWGRVEGRGLCCTT